MGCFDSLYIKCPKCRNDLEFQSKSGMSCLYSFRKSNLPIEVAIGMEGNIIRCQFCNSRIRLNCKIPQRAKVSLTNLGTRNRYDYNGNYNEKHPSSIKNQKELNKIFGKKKSRRKDE